MYTILHMHIQRIHLLARTTMYIHCICVNVLCSHQEPSLWVQALSFFVSREDCRDKIPLVLHHIEEKNLLQPLMVVKLLAENRCATLSDIKPYIVRHLEEQNEAIAKVTVQLLHCVYAIIHV